MNGPSNTGSLRLTPQNKFIPTQTTGKSARTDTGLSLSLETVIGTTTTSTNGFGSDHESCSFAVCAGPAVVLSQLDENLNVIQRFFRARPDVWPINATPSFYNSPASQGTSEFRSRFASSLRDKGYGRTTAVDTIGVSCWESPGRSKASKRTRYASCVSLSPGGKLLAIGEVSRRIQLGLMPPTPAFALCSATDPCFTILNIDLFRSNSKVLRCYYEYP